MQQMEEMKEIEIDSTSKPTKKENTILYIIRLIKSNPIMQIKTNCCKHEQGCLYNILEGMIRSFIMAYGIKALLAFISVIMARNKKVSKSKQLLEGLFGSDTMQFAIFPAVYNGIQKGVLCGSRHIFQEDKKIASFFSGLLAGMISLRIMDENKRKNWALYLLTRAFDTVFHSLQNRGIVKFRSYYYVIFMGLEVLITSYAFGSETDCLEDYMHKFYNRFGGEHKSERDYRQCWHEKKNIILRNSYKHLQ